MIGLVGTFAFLSVYDKEPNTNVVGNTPVQQEYSDYTQRINESEKRITDLILERNHYILSKKESGEPFDEEFARKVYESRINLEWKAIDSWKASRSNLPISKQEIENRFKN